MTVIGVEYTDEQRPVETYVGLYVFIDSEDQVDFQSGKGVRQDEADLMAYLK